MSIPLGQGTSDGDMSFPGITFASGRFLGNIGAPLRSDGDGGDTEQDGYMDANSGSGYILRASRPPTRLSRLGFEELRTSPNLEYL